MPRRRQHSGKRPLMAHVETTLPRAESAASSLRWRELWLKEDWWAIWLGLGIVLTALILFAQGSSIAWLAVTPAKWSTFSQLGSHFAANGLRYVAQFAVWLAVFTVALSTLGYRARVYPLLRRTIHPVDRGVRDRTVGQGQHL